MQNKGIFLVLSTAIISGISIFINQFGAKAINSYIFTGLKNIVVALCLGGIILMLKERQDLKKISRKNWLSLIIIGIIGGSIPFLMFFKGLSMTSGPEASYIHKFLFIFIAILAPIFLKEKLKWHYLIGLLFLLIGGILLFKINGVFSLDFGDLLVLGATFLWAIENLISKKLVSEISPKIVAWGRMTFGSLIIICYWIITGQTSALLDLNFFNIMFVLITSILLLGYVYTWYTGLKYMPLIYAVAILALGAPITSLLEIFQGKIYSFSQIIGISLMFWGVIVFIILERKRDKLVLNYS
ncbi:MAG: DMT family transporter [Patescibacteria group bacterium]|nr:DMT family transporter [Patescibacteria group bacterium]